MITHESVAPERLWAVGLSRLDLAFIAFIAAFLYLQLFVLPGTPVYVENDQLLPVSNAMRLLDGEVMYRDFFHFAPPGTELYYAAAFSVFGVKIWVLNATIFLLGAAQLAILFTISKKLLPGSYAYLPALIYFIVGFRQFGIDGSYRLFSVVFALCAVLIVAFRRDTKAIIAAAVFCGLSTFFVQTRGLLGIGALGIFLLWDNFRVGFQFRRLIRDWVSASVTFLLVVIATQFYMAWLGGFDTYFFANVTFLKDHYGADALSNTFAYFSDLPNLDSYIETYGTAPGLFRFVRVAAPTLFWYALVPLAYVAYFIYRFVRNGDPKSDRTLMLLSIFGLVLYIGASAPTAFRLYHISMPAVIILVWLLLRMPAGKFIASGLMVGLLILGALYSVQRQTVEHKVLELPAGRAAFLGVDTAEKYIWLGKETEPGEYIYEAQHPSYYFPLHLKNPTPFYLIRDNNYTPAFQVERLLASLRSNPPRLIAWHGGWTKEPYEREPGDNLAPLWDFIRQNYRLKKEFLEQGEFTKNSRRQIEFWEKRTDVDIPRMDLPQAP